MLGAESTVIGPDDVDDVVVEHFHEVGFGGGVGADWRRHYVTAGDVPGRIPKAFSVDPDGGGQGLAEHEVSSKFCS